MIPRLLSSLQHPLVKKLVKLRGSRSFRQQEKAVLIVGETVVREIAQSCVLKTLISTKPSSIPAQTRLLATKEVIQKIIGHTTEDLWVAEVPLPPPSDLAKAELIVVLDQISDPGNVGTIFRTALALGWEGILVIEGTVDPYNDKALRASRAAPLKLPWCTGSWKDVEKLLKDSSRKLFIADIKGSALFQMEFKKPLLLVLGHETKGPSAAARRLGTPITIPMKGAMESLNVSSAASIILYHIQQVST